MAYWPYLLYWTHAMIYPLTQTFITPPTMTLLWVLVLSTTLFPFSPSTLLTSPALMDSMKQIHICDMGASGWNVCNMSQFETQVCLMDDYHWWWLLTTLSFPSLNLSLTWGLVSPALLDPTQQVHFLYLKAPGWNVALTLLHLPLTLPLGFDLTRTIGLQTWDHSKIFGGEVKHMFSKAHFTEYIYFFL